MVRGDPGDCQTCGLGSGGDDTPGSGRTNWGERPPPTATAFYRFGMTTVEGIRTARASRQGVREYCADAAAIHTPPGSSIVAAAVVDGIGSTAEVAAWAHVAAEVAARVGARRTAMMGLLAAAELTAAPAAEMAPDGVAVVAVAHPGDEVSIAWTGDARAYGWDGSRLLQYSTDQTMGEWLRVSGGPAVDLSTAAGHDHWILSTLGRASIAAVRTTQIPDGLIILTSDGVHDALEREVMERLVKEYAGDPQALADALVSAVGDDGDGYRDDATVVVLALG